MTFYYKNATGYARARTKPLEISTRIY